MVSLRSRWRSPRRPTRPSRPSQPQSCPSPLSPDALVFIPAPPPAPCASIGAVPAMLPPVPAVPVPAVPVPMVPAVPVPVPPAVPVPIVPAPTVPAPAVPVPAVPVPAVPVPVVPAPVVPVACARARAGAVAPATTKLSPSAPALTARRIPRKSVLRMTLFPSVECDPSGYCSRRPLHSQRWNSLPRVGHPRRARPNGRSLSKRDAENDRDVASALAGRECRHVAGFHEELRHPETPGDAAACVQRGPRG